MRERDDDVEALAEQPLQLVLGLGEPARDERRALRVERERLALRQRVELGRAVERELGEALLAPDRAHLVGLPDEVGRRGERRHEIGRDLELASSSSSRQPDLDGVAAPLGRRVDRDLARPRAARAG